MRSHRAAVVMTCEEKPVYVAPERGGFLLLPLPFFFFFASPKVQLRWHLWVALISPCVLERPRWKRRRGRGSVVSWLRVDCCRCSFWSCYITPLGRGTRTAVYFRLYGESFKAVNIYRKHSLSLFTCVQTPACTFSFSGLTINPSRHFIYERVCRN